MLCLMAFEGEEVDISVDKVIGEVKSRSISGNGSIHIKVNGLFGEDSTDVKLPNIHIYSMDFFDI